MILPTSTDYRYLLCLAADHLEFALYEREAEGLRRLAEAPIFSSDLAAAEVISRYSQMLTEAMYEDDLSPAALNRIRKQALAELRGEQGRD